MRDDLQIPTPHPQRLKHHHPKKKKKQVEKPWWFLERELTFILMWIYRKYRNNFKRIHKLRVSSSPTREDFVLLNSRGPTLTRQHQQIQLKQATNKSARTHTHTKPAFRHLEYWNGESNIYLKKETRQELWVTNMEEINALSKSIDTLFFSGGFFSKT